MKEKITEILNDDTIDNIDERVDRIAKEIALLTVPKDKYNNMSDRVKKIETEKSELQSKYDELEKKHMTAEELKTKELEDIANQKRELALERNKVKAEGLLKKANIEEKQIESLLEKVVSDDETKTIELTNSFIEILNSKVEETKKQTTTDLLNGTKKPDVKNSGNEPKDITLEDFKKMSYGERKTLLANDANKYNELVKAEYEKL